MNRAVVYIAGFTGACALVGSVLTGAVASVPPPFHNDAVSARTTTMKANVRVTGVLRVDKNLSAYGHLYAHNALQVWKGLLVRNGGTKTDTLDVSGALTAGSATIAGALQGGAISGTSLAINGAATVNGGLTATGAVKGNGLDAGAGAITTTGGVTAGTVNAASITTSGALTAGGAATFSNGLAVSGPVDFSKATISGLSVSNISLNGATVPTLNVGNLLTLGTSTNTTSPLTLQENGKTVQVGVDTNGNMTVNGNLAVSGNLSVSGSTNLVVSNLSSPPVSGSNAAGGTTLTLQGSPIVLSSTQISLNGPTSMGSGSDFTLPASTNAVSHLIGNADIAGTATVTVPASTGIGTPITVNVPFAKQYATAPLVVVSPVGDPAPGCSAQPKYWAAASTTSFTLTYAPMASVGTTAPCAGPYNVTFDYHVIGH